MNGGALSGRSCGGADAFETLVRQHEAALYRGAYRLTGNREDAQDLLMEVLVEAFAAFPRFRLGTQFVSWAMRIMTRTFIDWTRRRTRLSIESLEAPERSDGDGSIARQVPDSRPGPEMALLEQALEGPLQAALDALPAEFRLAVVLCDVEGLAYEEAARAAGCPVGTIRSRLHRARELLRRQLGPSLRMVYGEGA
jgi:RNA polymerase sigma-70 factor (ECF subfamily)